ncbi:hypothetical protein [Cytobacillus firmus]|uniref:hypothetical protein n=1 Tax=Cytobacillus firmus TaxID=1399 RepID=UPI0018CDDC53|nr:hypothetical protein [Cytobacillus firmus]MBG9589529.1 hypothetical protein [Cytobacillus firmus]
MRERFENVQQEQKEITKAFDVIREITNGQFNYGGKDMTYHGDVEHYKYMLQQFESVKPVLFYTHNNKWLIMEYLAEHRQYMNSDNPHSLAQLISILLGFQGQDAIDNNDELLNDKFHIETCIWSGINMHAKYRLDKAN